MLENALREAAALRQIPQSRKDASSVGRYSERVIVSARDSSSSGLSAVDRRDCPIGDLKDL
jgi:hypothetical protein